MTSGEVAAEQERAAAFGGRVREHLLRVERANGAVLDRVAEALVDVVRSDGLVYAGGTGHSTALVLETFYRAGGLACVYPLSHPRLNPLEAASSSTAAEREEGFGTSLLEGIVAGPDDLAVIFSNSGVNAVPIELADGFRGRGTPVVAVVSVPTMAQAPARVGRKLGDLATHVIDTMVPAGDAAFEIGEAATAPLSSITSAFVWDLILARAAERAAAAGVDLPLWASSNVEGGDEGNAALLERYRGRIPRL